MATVYKVLGQVAPNATTETTLYTVPALKSAVVSTFTVTNRSSTLTTFRVSVSVGGGANGATEAKDYIYYDLTIAGYDTFAATYGLTLGAGDVVRVYSTTNTLSFSIFGQEIQ